MVEVRRVSDDALVLFVEGLHRPPCEGHPAGQHIGMRRQRGIVPCRVIGLVPVGGDGEPPGRTEIAVLGDAVFFGQHSRLDIALGKVRDRIAAGFMQQHHVLAVDDVLTPEFDAHPAAQGLRVQQPLRHRLRCEEVPNRCGGQWPLLPCQSHRRGPFCAHKWVT
jgi:hypothetical protein